MSELKQGYQNLMALKDALKSARKFAISTRKAKQAALDSGFGAECVSASDATLAALIETIKTAEKQAKLAHGYLAEYRALSVQEGQSDPAGDPDDDIPVT